MKDRRTNWLIGYFGFNDSLRQHFSLYRSVFQIFFKFIIYIYSTLATFIINPEGQKTMWRTNVQTACHMPPDMQG